MKSHDSQMSRTASIYAKEAREGFVRTGTGPSYAQSDEKARQTTPNSRGRASPAAMRLTHEQVAERARALWLASGCLPGRDEQNWLEAEAQLKAELKSH
jgi:hypothetical protein